MAVVKNLMVRCGADFSALTKATTQAKSSISSMSRSTQKATTSIRQSAGSMPEVGLHRGKIGLLRLFRNRESHQGGRHYGSGAGRS